MDGPKAYFTQSTTLLLLCTIFTSLVLQSVHMICFDDTFYFALPVSLFFSLGILYKSAKSIKLFLCIFLYSFVIITCFLNFSFLYPDTSWDGFAYHQAISNAINENINVFDKGKEAWSFTFWSYLYPKGFEIFAGEILKFFPKINGNGFNIFLMAFIIFNYAFYFSKKCHFTLFKTILFSIFSTFTPLFFQQLYTFYVDYLLYACSYILIIAMILIIKRENNYWDYFLFIAAGSIAIVVKMSGVLYPASALLIIFLYSLLYKKDVITIIKNNFPSISSIFNNIFSKINMVYAIQKNITLGVPIFIIGFMLLGANPFIINLTEGKHLFHPLAGKEKIDILPSARPLKFNEMNNASRFIISIFSVSGLTAQREYQLKYPFTLTSSEKNNLGSYDLRVSGWGVYFSGILLLSLVLLILYKLNTSIFLPYLFFTLLCMVILKEVWWARYFPQLSLLPVFILISIKDLRWKMKPYFPKLVYCLLVLLLIINVALAANSKKNHLEYTHQAMLSIVERYSLGEISFCRDREYFDLKQFALFYDLDLADLYAICPDNRDVINRYPFKYYENDIKTIHNSLLERLPRILANTKIITNTKNMKGIYLIGFSNPETWGTWSDDKKTSIVLKLEKGITGMTLQGNYFAPNGRIQNVKVSVNNTFLFETDNKESPKEIRIDFPQEIINTFDGETLVTVTLDLPDAVSPKSLGLSGDTRDLAFGLKEIEVF